METNRFASNATLKIADFVITTDFDSLAIVNEAMLQEISTLRKLLLLCTKKNIILTKVRYF